MSHPQQPADMVDPGVYSGDKFEPGYGLVEGFSWNKADLDASLGVPATMPDLDSFEHTEGMDWSSWNDLLVNYRTGDISGFAGDIDLTGINFE
jgi:hypothetical protein